MVADLFGKKAHLDITTEKTTYQLGEKVHATVRVHADSDLDVRGGRVVLQYTAHQKNRERHRQQYGQGSQVGHVEVSTVDDVDRIEVGSHDLVPAGTLKGDSDQTIEAKFTIPADACPSGKGNIIRVEWEVHANLDVSHAIDPKGELALTVLAPASSYAQRELQPAQCNNPSCQMNFALPGPALRAGETVAGSLIVQATEEVSSSGIRVDLLRIETVGGQLHNNWNLFMGDILGTNPWNWQEIGNHHTETVATVEIPGSEHLQAGVRQELPFQLTVPADAIPTMETPRGEVHWLLKASVNRRLHTDYTLAQEVIVCTAPA